jgi:hypothetical protein
MSIFKEGIGKNEDDEQTALTAGPFGSRMT